MPPLRTAGGTIRATEEDLILDVNVVDTPAVRYRLHWIPGVSLLYSLFVKCPSPAGLQNSLNGMGLLSALMLTIDAVLPFAYNHDDYTQAIARWNNSALIDTDGTLYPPGDARRETLPHANKYEDFVNRWSAGFTMLSISVILAVLLSAALSHTTFRTSRNKRLDPEAMVRWWSFMRPVYAYMFLMLILGTVYTCFSIHSLLMLFLPKPAGKPYPLGYNPWSILGGNDIYSRADASVALARDFQLFFLLPGLVALLFISCAVCANIEAAKRERTEPAPESYRKEVDA